MLTDSSGGIVRSSTRVDGPVPISPLFDGAKVVLPSTKSTTGEEVADNSASVATPAPPFSIAIV